MKIVQKNEKLFINDKEVKKIIFVDGSKEKTPFKQTGNLAAEIKAQVNSAIIQNSKNIITGDSKIVCGGDFHLGDK